MKTKLNLLAIIWIMAYNLCAQGISPAPGNSTVCPGELIVYTVNPNPNFSGCGSFTWTLTNGTFVFGQTVTSKVVPSGNFNVDVYWNDVAGNGTLTVTSSCAEGVLSVTKTYAIKSLAGRNPTNARANQTLLYCGILSINLSLDIMSLQNTGGVTGITQQFADGYEWVLPVGWSSGGVSGTVTTAAEIIDITPDNGCRGGTVTVRAYKNCASGKKYSSPASININRPTPSISITPQAGYAGPSCGTVQPVTFTVNHSLTCVSPSNGYLWVFPSGWAQSPIYTNSNSIMITPSGNANDQGPINVTLNLVCGSLPATPLILTYKTPVISISQPICDVGTPVSLTNVAPSVNVNWTVSSNMYVFSGQGTSSAVMKAVYVGSLGNGTINASVNCPNTTVAPKPVWVGSPSQPGAITGVTNPSVGGIYNYVSSPPSTGAAYYDWLMPYNGNPLWSWYGGTVSGPINTLTPNFLVGSSSGNLQIIGWNACGPSGASRLRVSPVSGGGGGIQQIHIYPNPVQKELIIEDVLLQEGNSKMISTEVIPDDFSISLFNSQNSKVKSGLSVKGKLILDIQDLPNGFYYLHVQKGDELITEQIQIKK